MQLAPRQLDLFGGVSPEGWRRAPPPPLTPLEVPTASQSAPAPEVRGGVRAAAPGSEFRARVQSRQEALEQARLLAQRIADRLGVELKVLLTVHDNRSTMISFRRQPPLLRLRLHHMFLEAPEAVVRAIVDYAGHGRRGAGQALDDFIAGRQERIRTTPRRAAALVSRGRCFDLEAIFNELNGAWFQGGIRARIGWGRRTQGRRRKSIRLGVYDHKSREIRVHPALDKPDVPAFFVEFIVFHEMLHQLFPSDRDTGRHVHHPRAFRDREKAFPRFAAAIAWEKEHLTQLLRR